jgi:IclR family mhp operon transcriptional activator
MDVQQEVKSLKKALRALTFMNQRGDATVSEVAKAIGIPRPTSYRILETLASEGYVEKQPHSDFYRITSLVQTLAAGFHDEAMLIEVAKSIILARGLELGWPITLCTPRDQNMIVRVNTDHECPLALERYPLGHVAPMLNVTTGYCFLAYCPDRERNELLNHMLQAGHSKHFVSSEQDEVRYLNVTDQASHLTRFRKDDINEINYLLKTVRDRGFCNIEFKQSREGNVGVPVLLGGKPVGGIVLRYIKSVMKNTNRVQDYYVPKLQELAREITDECLLRLEKKSDYRTS